VHLLGVKTGSFSFRILHHDSEMLSNWLKNVFRRMGLYGPNGSGIGVDKTI